MARILSASLLSALLVAACAGSSSPASPQASTATATPSPTTAPAATTPAPTVGPPSPTAVAACEPGPLTVAEFLAADDGCYRSAEVSVVGWWGGDLLRGSMPFRPVGETPEDLIFVDALGPTPIAGWPDGTHWATVTGHRSPTNDRACHDDVGADITAPPHCPSYLIASDVIESEPPATALRACSSMSIDEVGVLAVDTFTAYPPACFASTDVTVHGWFDIRYLIAGWTNPWGIVPGWLWMPIGPWTVVSPTSNAEESSALLVYEDPARAIDVTRTNRWVSLTGHYADPKAKTCHIEYAGGFDPARDGGRIPDSFAQRQCEVRFVVTAIDDANP